MAHIAIDARIINSSTGRYVERLLTYLEQLESPHDFTVLVPTADRDYWQPSRSNFKVKTVDFANYSFAEQIGFKRYLDALAPDLVHFCMPQQPAFYNGATVTTVHDLSQLRLTEVDDMSVPVLRFKQAVLKWLLRRVAGRTVQVITPSEYTKRDFITLTRISPERVSVTYEAADLLSTRPRTVTRLEHVPFILYVGRAEPYKNNRNLIQAHQLLLSKFPDLQLVIVGKKDTFRERDMQWVTEQGYKNVVFYGFADNAELAWLYAKCRAYVFPSFMEGFGLPGLEAMRHGAPVVSSDATCLPEIYGDAALYFDAHSHGDMAGKIEQVLSDDKIATKLRNRGDLCYKQYSWERMAQQTLDIYEDALARTATADTVDA
ncbi:glycosyltransferase family 4 protein [Candidatus Saccharibacteria bacterium]|nr:glycosyltransferase family 4 protein [Candidatus Saccharibacteria bacterium]